MNNIPDFSFYFSSTDAMKNRALMDFKNEIWRYYEKYGRQFPWRNDHHPYQVFVSEVMLQQTQTDRVLQKFELFTKRFPNFKMLANADLCDVLAEWQGLGYNRRGLFLHRAAQIVTEKYGGELPKDCVLIDDLPGIGSATAASICAFAFNMPTVFIETNIRSVFIKVFGGCKNNIDDKKLLPLVEKTLDPQKPREWYYALMDYGVMVKKTCGNPNRQSKQYAKQSRFDGSDRQIRGEILRILLVKKRLDFAGMCAFFSECPERIERIIVGMCVDGILMKDADFFSIPRISCTAGS